MLSGRARAVAAAGLCVCALALVGCAAPPGVAPDPLGHLVAPSPRSVALAREYRRVQGLLRARGGLRVDDGERSASYTAGDLARNFERIALYDEYASGAGLGGSSQAPGALRRWERPVRVAVEFGDSVSAAARRRDRREVAAYVGRLSRAARHPVSFGGADPNFRVIFSGEDDRAATVARVRELVPEIGEKALELVADPPSSVYCMVMTFVESESESAYAFAVAFVRAEHPPLLRRACIHEELAQGLGLGNDSSQARPSVFNDDGEFALLTHHDEKLLRILYDPALRPGMTLREARPRIAEIAAKAHARM